MSSLAERLAGIRVRARVSGTEIEAELRHRDQVTVSFGPSVYEWLDEPTLERFLASIARLVAAGWAREYRAALSETLLEPGEPGREFVAARDELVATGASADGRVTISSVGLHVFTVRITPGTLRALSSRDFAERTREAVSY